MRSSLTRSCGELPPSRTLTMHRQCSSGASARSTRCTRGRRWGRFCRSVGRQADLIALPPARHASEAPVRGLHSAMRHCPGSCLDPAARRHRLLARGCDGPISASRAAPSTTAPWPSTLLALRAARRRIRPSGSTSRAGKSASATSQSTRAIPRMRSCSISTLSAPTSSPARSCP